MEASIIISSLALIVSFGSVWFTYKTAKHQKYVDTITSQRILWLETLRKDFSIIFSFISNIYRFQIFKMSYFEKDLTSGSNDSTISAIFDLNLRAANEFFEKLPINSIEIIEKIHLLILRLNPVDDAALISKLNDIKNSLESLEYYNFNSSFMLDIRNTAHKTLKNEWEKVKKEAHFNFKRTKAPNPLR